MPIIYGDTTRDVRIWSALSARQALELLGTGALAWLAASMPAQAWIRWGSAGIIAVTGTAYAIGRWPLGPNGERASLWLRRAVRYALSRRALTGALVPGWDGVVDIRRGCIRSPSGWSAVLEWTGGDPGLRGEGATEAAQTIFRELLHALPGNIEVVGIVRPATLRDHPVCWTAECRSNPLAGVARAYGEHWAQLVRTGAVMLRRTLVVLTVGERMPEALSKLEVAVSAAARCAVRLGLGTRRIVGAELIALLRTEAAAHDVRPTVNGDAAPSVVRSRA